MPVIWKLKNSLIKNYHPARVMVMSNVLMAYLVQNRKHYWIYYAKDYYLLLKQYKYYKIIQDDWLQFALIF